MSEHIADKIAAFSGSMPFFYTNAAVFAAWILINACGPPRFRFDPFPFQLLTLSVSLEAIFLTVFILIAQNRQAAADRRMVQTDAQTNQYAEAEIRLLMEHLGKQDAQLARIEQVLTERNRS